MNILKRTFNVMYVEPHPHQDHLKTMTQPFLLWMCLLRYTGVHPVSPPQQRPSCFKGKGSKSGYSKVVLTSLIPPSLHGGSVKRDRENTEHLRTTPEPSRAKALIIFPSKEGRREKTMTNTRNHIWVALSKEECGSLILFTNILLNPGNKNCSLPGTFCGMSSYKNDQIISTCPSGKSLGKIKILAQGRVANKWQSWDQGSRGLSGKSRSLSAS